MTRAETVGWIGAECDPVAQLHAIADDACVMRKLRAVSPGLAGIDRVLITSQHGFLAHAEVLRAFAGDLQIVLRRKSRDETEDQWAQSLRILKHVIAGWDGGTVTCRALTQEAAGELADLMGVRVTPLAPLPRARAATMTGTLDDEIGRITLPDGRALDTMAMHWGRLRQRIRLLPSDTAAPDTRDLLAYAQGDDAPLPPPAATRESRILFIIPNGVGLGHMTRVLAIAAALRDGHGVSSMIWSYSSAIHLAENRDVPVIFRQTARHMNARPIHWRQWEALDLARCIRERGIDLVAYDGSTIDPAILSAMADPGSLNCGLVWIRRGMWWADSRADVLDAVQHCELVIEPGDLADSADHGPTKTYRPELAGFADTKGTAPIMLVKRQDMPNRRKARRRLGLKTTGPLLLVSLGSDAVIDRSAIAAQIARVSAETGLRVAWSQSPLAAPMELYRNVGTMLRVFPIGRYLNAFDGVIAAAGYNTFHEVMALTDVPVLFSPSVHASLDDQLGRAEFAARQGWAKVLPTNQNRGAAEVFYDFIDAVRRRDRIARTLDVPDGAGEAARLLADHLKER